MSPEDYEKLTAGRRFRKMENHTLGSDSQDDFLIDVGEWCAQDDPERTVVTSMSVLNTFGQATGPTHLLVIDLDMECHLEPSTTPGHGHLYLNRLVSQEGFVEILTVLAKHGIVEDGYAQSCIRQGYSSVRVPEVKKP